jgi:hypothetical protein
MTGFDRFAVGWMVGGMVAIAAKFTVWAVLLMCVLSGSLYWRYARP